MRSPLVPALVCLAAVGCSHRHLILAQAPVGTRAVADKIASGWRITLLVEGAGWEAISPDETLALERMDAGDRTQFSWSVSRPRWETEQGYLISLKRGDQSLDLSVQNRSQEARIAQGVAVGVVVVGLVALAVATQRGKGSGPSAKPGLRPTPPGALPRGTGVPHPTHPHSGTFQVSLPFSDPVVGVDLLAEPLVSVEVLEEAAFPGPLSASLRPVRDGWEVEVDLGSLPEDETWQVAGEGFEATGMRSGRVLVVRWTAVKTERSEGRAFTLAFSGPARTCRARIRVQ